MSFVPDITAAQCCDCTKVTLTDNSDYTDEPKSGFTSRSIKLKTGYGGYYRPPGYNTDVINWPLSDNTLDIELGQDYAFDIEYTIVPVTPVSGSTYFKNFYVACACNLRAANDSLIKFRLIDQAKLNLNSYRSVLQDVQIEYLITQRQIQSGDIYGSQDALDRGIGVYNDYNQNPGL